jgi:hypothetical protein
MCPSVSRLAQPAGVAAPRRALRRNRSVHMHDVGLIGCGQTNKGTPTLSSWFRQKATWITSAGAMRRVLSCARRQRLSSVRFEQRNRVALLFGIFDPCAGCRTSRRADHRGLPRDHPGSTQPRQRRRISARRQARRRSSPGPPFMSPTTSGPQAVLDDPGRAPSAIDLLCHKACASLVA